MRYSYLIRHTSSLTIANDTNYKKKFNKKKNSDGTLSQTTVVRCLTIVSLQRAERTTFYYRTCVGVKATISLWIRKTNTSTTIFSTHERSTPYSFLNRRPAVFHRDFLRTIFLWVTGKIEKWHVFEVQSVSNFRAIVTNIFSNFYIYFQKVLRKKK